MHCSLPLAKEGGGKVGGGNFSWLGIKGGGGSGGPATLQDCLTAFAADEKLEV